MLVLRHAANPWPEAVPHTVALTDLCCSSGLTAIGVSSWPTEAPGRCMVMATPTTGEPEYLGMSYELPLSRTSAPGYHLPGDDPARRDSRSVFSMSLF
jgi:hypothetical protein